MSRLFRHRALLALVMVLPLGGCLFRSHRVERQVNTAPLKSATQQELIDFINSQAAKIKTMQATVDIDASVGGEKKGKVTDYQEIRGYVLARKPAMLRMIGLMPIVRNKAFDMVSDGHEFKLWIPAKNRLSSAITNLSALLASRWRTCAPSISMMLFSCARSIRRMKLPFWRTTTKS